MPMQGPCGGARLWYTDRGTGPVGAPCLYTRHEASRTPPSHVVSSIFGFGLGLRPGPDPGWTTPQTAKFPLFGVF